MHFKFYLISRCIFVKKPISLFVLFVAQFCRNELWHGVKLDAQNVRELAVQQVSAPRASAVVKGRKPLALGLAGPVLGVDVPHHPQQPMAVAALQGLTVLLLAGIGVRLVGGGRIWSIASSSLWWAAGACGPTALGWLGGRRWSYFWS